MDLGPIAVVAPAMRLRNAASRGAALERGLPLLQGGGRVLIDAARSEGVPSSQAPFDRSEREFYEPIAELYLKIAQELEAMMGG